MSRTFRDAVQMDRERRDPREPFIPDANAAKDWAEFEAYLDQGVVGVEIFAMNQANLELSAIADNLQRLQGQIESHRQMRADWPHKSVVVTVDEIEMVDQLLVLEPCVLNADELRELIG